MSSSRRGHSDTRFLDGLRASQRSLSCLHHLLIVTVGAYAVMVFFFVISGYCVHCCGGKVVVASRWHSGTFMRRRLHRIYHRTFYDRFFSTYATRQGRNNR